MSRQQTRSSARVVAPLALVVCAIAFFAVLASSGTGDGDGGVQEPAQAPPTTAPSTRDEPPEEPRRRQAHTVEVGDNLDGIAETTGVDVETLLELNPELDPQALEVGQRIKLRE